MSTAAADPQPIREGQLFGPAVDLLIGCGLGYLLSIPLLYWVGTASNTATWPPVLVLVMGLLVNSPHYGATLVRVYEDREDRRKYALFSIYATVALVAALVAASHSVWIASLLTTVYVTWAPWHFSGQNYGLTLMFLRRRGVAFDAGVKRALYASFVLSALLAILAIHSGHGEMVFAPETLPVANAPTIFYASLPAPIGSIAFGAALLGYLVCLGAVGWKLLRHPRLADLAPAALLVASQALWFTVPATLLDWNAARGESLVFAAVWISTAHSLQYLWVTAYYERASPRRTPVPRFLLKCFVAGAALATLPALVLAPDRLGALPIDVGLAAAAFAAINVHHFVLDGAIWKLRDGRVARVLLRAPDPTARAEASHARAGGWLRRLVWGVASLAVAVYALEYAALRVVVQSRDPAQLARASQVLRALGQERVQMNYDVGRRLAAAGHREEATAYFERSIELFPTGRAWGALGAIHRAQGRWDLALKDFDAAIALNPEFFGAHHRRAEALLALASPEEAPEARERASAALARALEISRGYTPAALMLADLQAESGRNEEAVATLEAALVEARPADAARVQQRLAELR